MSVSFSAVHDPAPSLDRPSYYRPKLKGPESLEPSVKQVRPGSDSFPELKEAEELSARPAQPSARLMQNRSRGGGHGFWRPPLVAGEPKPDGTGLQSGGGRSTMLGSEAMFGWDGAASTICWIDPKENTVLVMITQRFPFNAEDFLNAFVNAYYAAFND